MRDTTDPTTLQIDDLQRGGYAVETTPYGLQHEPPPPAVETFAPRPEHPGCRAGTPFSH